MQKSPLSLAWGLGYRIALPIVLFALGGRFLDKKFNTKFVFLLIGILLSMITSGYLVYRETKEVLNNEDINSR